MGSRYLLRTLGSLGVDVTGEGDVRATLLPSGKPAALLTYLALAPGRSVLRDELVDVLWANLDVDRARLSLRQALFQLRSTIGHGAILTEGRRVVLAGEIEVDLLDFRRLAEEERAEALDRFAGGFLDGISFPGSAIFEQWAERERARTDAMLLRCAERCTKEALANAQTDGAIRLALRAREFLPREQEAWRLVVETYLAAGDRALATLEGELLSKWLSAEGIEPSASVSRTIRQVQRASGEARAASTEYESEFVGREGDLSELLKSYHSVTTGHSRHVHVTAKAGLGKSRLLAEFGARCRLMRGRVVSVAALPSDRGLPWALLARVVATLGTLPGAMAVAPASARALVRLAPALSSRFEVVAITPGAADDELTRSQVFRELVDAVAVERTLVLLLDDLHWSDAESLAALQRLSEQLPTNLVLVTSTRPPVALGDVPTSRTRELAPLGDEYVRDMLATLGLSASDAPAARIVHAITIAARGSPLNVLQLVRQGLEAGWLRREGEGLLAADDLCAADLSRLDPVSGRLRDLPEIDARVLLALARGGMPLDESTLVEVVAADVHDSLQRLAARGLVTPAPPGWSCAHDVIAEKYLAQCSPESIKSVCMALGRALANGATTLAQSRVASRLLVEGGDTDALRRLLQRHISRQRKDGRDIGAVASARQLFGESLPDEQLKSLAHSLPIVMRVRRRTLQLASAVVVCTAAATALAASRHASATLVAAQIPLGSAQALLDSSKLELRPALLIERRDRRGQPILDAVDTIDVTLRDSVSGILRTTTQVLNNGRATFPLLQGGNLRLRDAVVRRRGADDSLLVQVRWGDEGAVRLRLVSLRVGVVEVSPLHPSLRVPPGADVSGVLRIEYSSHYTNETLTYAWTPTWGDAAKQARRFGVLSTPTEWRSRDDPLRFTAPTVPGEYFIVIVGGPEEGERFLLSGTNWVMKEPRWGDGNDVAGWPREMLRRVVNGRDVAVQSKILRMTDGRPTISPDRHYPIVIRVVVDANTRAVSAE